MIANLFTLADPNFLLLLYGLACLAVLVVGGWVSLGFRDR